MKRLFFGILVIAAIVCESERITGGEDEKNAAKSSLVFLNYQIAIKTGLAIDVVEDNGIQHRLEHGQTYRWWPLDSRSIQLDYLALALRGSDGLIHYFWLPRIKRIEKTSATKHKVTLTDGRSTEGKWEPAHQIYYYHESKDPRIVGEVRQENQPRWAYLPAQKIKSLTIEATNAPDLQALLEGDIPKTHLVVELKDGRIFQGPGYIVDYCGHWASTTWHKRLGWDLLYWDGDVTQDYTVNNRPQSVPVGKLKEIQLTGKFGENLPHAREALLRLTDGSEKRVFLELTSESYGGNEYHSRSYRDYDSCLLFQEYGALALPLDSIQTISVMHEHVSAPNTPSFTIALPGGSNFIKVGESITISGTDYFAFENVMISFGPAGAEQVVKTVPALADGTFTTTIPIATQPGGVKRLKAEGVLSHATRPDGVTIPTVVKTITIQAQILSVQPNIAKPGDLIQVTGNGLGASERIQLDLGTQTNIPLASGETSKADGTFELTFHVPAISAGPKELKVTGVTSGQTGTQKNAVTVGAGITQIQPQTGSVGTEVTVEGSNFGATEEVNIDFGTTIGIAKAITDANGSFRMTFSVTAAQKNGNMTIKATGVKSGQEAIDNSFVYAGARITSVKVEGSPAKDGGKVVVILEGEAKGKATFSIEKVALAKDLLMVEDPAKPGTYTGEYVVQKGVDVKDAVLTVVLTDAAGNLNTDTSQKVTLDGVTPVIKDAEVKPRRVKNGDTFVIKVTTETNAQVTADVSLVDTTQKEVLLQESAVSKGVYIASVTVSKENKAAEGTKTIKVLVSDVAGNSTSQTASIELKQIREFTLALNKGTNLIAVPLKDERVKKVSDLANLLGSDVSLLISYNFEKAKFQSFIPGTTPETAPENLEIKGDTGLIVVMKAPSSVTFQGVAWDGKVALKGISLLGIPLKDPRLAKVSDFAKREESKGLVSLIISFNAEQGKFQSFVPGTTPETAPSNVPIDGGVGFIVVVKGAVSFTVTGTAWENKSLPAAPPIAQFLPSEPTVSPVLELDGVLKSEDTGVRLNGFDVTVWHLPSGLALTDTTGNIAGDGRFSVTFVDFAVNHPLQVGDVLLISANGTASYQMEPIRYTVTSRDLAAGRVALGELVVRRIPSRSALLPNFPNPFNPETWIPFKLAQAADVQIQIYDVAGRLVRTLNLGKVDAGTYVSKAKAAYWDGKNYKGERVASGVYFYHIKAGQFTAVRRMVVQK